MEYNGSVDSKVFHRFIMEGTAYVKDGEVPSKKQVFILSHYLTGKAHEFYCRHSSENYSIIVSQLTTESNFERSCIPVTKGIKPSVTIYTS